MCVRDAGAPGGTGSPCLTPTFRLWTPSVHLIPPAVLICEGTADSAGDTQGSATLRVSPWSCFSVLESAGGRDPSEKGQIPGVSPGPESYILINRGSSYPLKDPRAQYWAKTMSAGRKQQLEGPGEEAEAMPSETRGTKEEGYARGKGPTEVKQSLTKDRKIHSGGTRSSLRTLRQSTDLGV